MIIVLFSRSQAHIKSMFTVDCAVQIDVHFTAETQSGLPFVLHLRLKSNLFVFSFFLVYNNL